MVHDPDRVEADVVGLADDPGEGRADRSGPPGHVNDEICRPSFMSGRSVAGFANVPARHPGGPSRRTVRETAFEVLRSERIRHIITSRPALIGLFTAIATLAVAACTNRDRRRSRD